MDIKVGDRVKFNSVAKSGLKMVYGIANGRTFRVLEVLSGRDIKNRLVVVLDTPLAEFGNTHYSTLWLDKIIKKMPRQLPDWW